MLVGVRGRAPEKLIEGSILLAPARNRRTRRRWRPFAVLLAGIAWVLVAWQLSIGASPARHRSAGGRASASAPARAGGSAGARSHRRQGAGSSPATGSSGTTAGSGASGVSGTSGASGASGPSGVSGASGASGASSTTGPSGPTAATGPSGASTTTGPSGTTTGPSGTTAATGPSGASATTEPQASTASVRTLERLAHRRTSQFALGGVAAVLLRADHPSARVVIWLHGAYQTASSLLRTPVSAPAVAALLRHGYAVASSDAGGNSWGDAAGLQDELALAAALRARGLTSIYVIAESMGGLDGLRLLDYLRPRAWVGIYPACNLGSLMSDPTLAPSITAAWGPQLAAGIAAESPVHPTHVRGLSMTFLASASDTVVPAGANAYPCATDLSSAGAHVTIVYTHGQHGDPSNYHPNVILQALRGAAGG